MNWWDQDLSSWPGPAEDDTNVRFAPGTIVAYESNPSQPIGVVLEVAQWEDDFPPQVRFTSTYNGVATQGLPVYRAAPSNTLVPYSAG